MPAPGYASVADVKDEIINVDFGSNTKLTTARLVRTKSKINGEINAALATGGYSVPQIISTTTTTSGAEVASTDTEVIGVADATDFSTGLTNGQTTIRIYGLSSTDFNDDFTEMVSISSNDITVFALGAAFDSGATVELLSEGLKTLRSCESKGTASRALNTIDSRSGRRNEKVDEMKKWYDECIKMIRDGELLLDGLTKKTTDAIRSLQVDDSDEDNVIFTLDMNF
jgi:hypothetical protein